LNRLCLAGWLVLQLWSSAPASAAEIKLDFLMDSDPELMLPESIQEIPPNLQALWIQALDRSLDASLGEQEQVGRIDMQRMAAETIARAHQHGIPGLNEAIPRLEQILVAETSHAAARFAAARALIVLDSRASAEKLLTASQAYGSDLRQLVEPALATWDFGAAKQVWIDRLASAETGPRDLILAMRGLGIVREPSVLPSLLSITGDPTRNADIRLEAAAAAGLIAESGLETDAERLAGSSGTSELVNQLCAVRLLSRQADEASRKLLIDLAGRKQPAVAAAALARLNEIDPALVLPLADAAIQNSDAEVRRQGAVSLLRLPAVERIPSIAKLLADPHPGLRREISAGLYELAQQPELNDPIRTAAMEVLTADRWQGQEQAAMLLGALAHQPAATRLVELQESPRVEVRLPAAWALRKIADPATIPALISHATRLTTFRQNGELAGLDEQVAHLLEALGVLQATDSTSLLMQYVPKRVSRNDLSRGSAIWALGRINAGQRNAEIETALSERIRDFEPQPSERLLIKQMSAISLGRIQAAEEAPMMRDFATTLSKETAAGANAVALKRLELALIWAVKQLTGEELPPAKPLVASQMSWFLEPVP